MKRLMSIMTILVFALLFGLSGCESINDPVNESPKLQKPSDLGFRLSDSTVNATVDKLSKLQRPPLEFGLGGKWVVQFRYNDGGTSSCPIIMTFEVMNNWKWCDDNGDVSYYTWNNWLNLSSEYPIIIPPTIDKPLACTVPDLYTENSGGVYGEWSMASYIIYPIPGYYFSGILYGKLLKHYNGVNYDLEFMVNYSRKYVGAMFTFTGLIQLDNGQIVEFTGTQVSRTPDKLSNSCINIDEQQ